MSALASRCSFSRAIRSGSRDRGLNSTVAASRAYYLIEMTEMAADGRQSLCSVCPFSRDIKVRADGRGHHKKPHLMATTAAELTRRRRRLRSLARECRPSAAIEAGRESLSRERIAGEMPVRGASVVSPSLAVV